MFTHDSTGIDLEGSTFSVAPEGNYTLIIKEAVEKVTKNGDPMISAKCEIVGTDHAGKIVYHNVTFLPKTKKGAGMAVKFLKTIGEPYEGVYEVNSENWVGKTFDCKLKIEKDLKGQDRNSVAWTIDRIGGTADEVPF